ncbi:MAG: CBS domain-containing protein [Methylococcales bacterium]|nr:CBS domain-containing protein [Methylococcales bacterium]
MNTERKIICVRDIMKTDFKLIEGSDTVSAALSLMKQHQTSTLVVNKRYQEDEYGLLTSGDIARKVLAQDRSPDRVNVYEIMSCPVICVRPEMDIRLCSRLFERFNLVRAPVVDNNQIVGTVSPNALVLNGLYQLYATSFTEGARAVAPAS